MAITLTASSTSILIDILFPYQQIEDSMDAPPSPWTGYNWPMYDAPAQDLPRFELPRPRRNMGDNARDQLILAELIDRVVSEYAQAQEKGSC